MTSYIIALIRGARFSRTDSGNFYATHPLFPQLHASGVTEEDCFYDLQAQLGSELLKRLRDQQELPTLFGARTPTVDDDVGDLYDVPNIVFTP